MTRRLEILGRLKTIPRLPVAAVDSLAMLQDPCVAVESIVPKIAHDPAITADLLRVANSAAFVGFPECTALRDALVRLGNDRVRQVLVRAGLGTGGSKPLTGYGLSSGELLYHSMMVARGVVTLSKLLQIDVPPEGFTAGLLHSVGKLVLGTYLEVNGTAVTKYARNESVSFDEAERIVLGIDHAEVGAELLRLWELPESIVSAVRWHHLPEHSPDTKLAAQLIHLADTVVVREGIGAGVDGEMYPACSETAESLGFTASVAKELAIDLRGDSKRLEKMFGFAKVATEVAVETTVPPEMVGTGLPHTSVRAAEAPKKGLLSLFQKRSA